MEEVLGRLTVLEKKVNGCCACQGELKQQLGWCVKSIRESVQSNCASGSFQGLKMDYELDYELHVRGNLHTWTFESSPDCLRIRSVLLRHSKNDVPRLASATEECELRKLLPCTRGNLEISSGQTSNGRAGYFKLIHRIVDSMTTLRAEYEATSDYRRSAVQYVCTEVCAYLNCGLPYITSYSSEEDIPLLSSEDLFQDMWRAWRDQRRKKAARGKATPDSSQSSSQRTIHSHTSMESAPRSSQYRLRRGDLDARGRSSGTPSVEGSIKAEFDDLDDVWDLAGLRNFRMQTAADDDRYSEVESDEDAEQEYAVARASQGCSSSSSSSDKSCTAHSSAADNRSPVLLSSSMQPPSGERRRKGHAEAQLHRGSAQATKRSLSATQVNATSAHDIDRTPLQEVRSPKARRLEK